MYTSDNTKTVKCNTDNDKTAVCMRSDSVTSKAKTPPYESIVIACYGSIS